MTELSRKKQIKDKTARIICCAALYTVLALFIIGLFVFNGNYTKIYDSPQVYNGKVDFKGVDISSRDVACNLTGKWEFFYNKWIITDNETCKPDGMIDLPDVWTYKDFGNGRLPKTGYCSYRLYAENVQEGIELIVYRDYSNVAYRTFINGKLNYRSGTLSKDIRKTVVTGGVDEQIPYKTDGSPVEIVIEVSATDRGGLNAAPWLAASTSGISYGTGWRTFNYIALGITTAAVFISLLSFVFFKYKRDITVPVFMLALYAHFLTSKDFLYVFGMPTVVAVIAELISAFTAFAILAWHFCRNGAPLNKPFIISTAALGAVFVSLLIGFYGTPIAPVFAFLLFAAAAMYIVPYIFDRSLTAVQYCAYGILFTFMMSIFFFELCDWLGMLVFGTEFIFTVELMIIIGCFAVLWLWKLAKSARTAIRVGELECELQAVKSRALKAQIEPHFIYNSLTAIQAQYRDGLAQGDRAIEQFASHLRLVTDSNGDDLIPFDDEVRNVLNYFELENLRAAGRLELLLDLNYSDFSVPVLSLQPLVENAIRHGGLREKQDGYITLASEKNDRTVTVTVSDNGRGFDVTAQKLGVGIENTRKRLELINARILIESAPSNGTRVTIEIPLE